MSHCRLFDYESAGHHLGQLVADLGPKHIGRYLDRLVAVMGSERAFHAIAALANFEMNVRKLLLEVERLKTSYPDMSEPAQESDIPQAKWTISSDGNSLPNADEVERFKDLSPASPEPAQESDIPQAEWTKSSDMNQLPNAETPESPPHKTYFNLPYVHQGEHARINRGLHYRHVPIPCTRFQQQFSFPYRRLSRPRSHHGPSEVPVSDDPWSSRPLRGFSEGLEDSLISYSDLDRPYHPDRPLASGHSFNEDSYTEPNLASHDSYTPPGAHGLQCSMHATSHWPVFNRASHSLRHVDAIDIRTSDCLNRLKTAANRFVLLSVTPANRHVTVASPMKVDITYSLTFEFAHGDDAAAFVRAVNDNEVGADCIELLLPPSRPSPPIPRSVGEAVWRQGASRVLVLDGLGVELTCPFSLDHHVASCPYVTTARRGRLEWPPRFLNDNSTARLVFWDVRDAIVACRTWRASAAFKGVTVSYERQVEPPELEEEEKEEEEEEEEEDSWTPDTSATLSDNVKSLDGGEALRGHLPSSMLEGEPNNHDDHEGCLAGSSEQVANSISQSHAAKVDAQ